MGVAGFTPLAGTAAPLLMGVGASVAVAAFGYAVYKAIPPVLRRPEDAVGETIDISELDDIYPPLLRLAIVGPTKAGKTTLKNRLGFQKKPDQRTQSVTAYILFVPATPPKYVAILDGGGERLPQQFRISELAHCLCLVLDHNESDSETALVRERLNDHTEFLTQIRYQLNDANCTRKRWIEILINKRDLWEKAPPEEKADFESFCKKEIEKWSSGGFAETVASNRHSNEIGDDIARFMSQIVTTVTE